jgi:hypothetical protein
MLLKKNINISINKKKANLTGGADPTSAGADPPGADLTGVHLPHPNNEETAMTKEAHMQKSVNDFILTICHLNKEIINKMLQNRRDIQNLLGIYLSTPQTQNDSGEFRDGDMQGTSPQNKPMDMDQPPATAAAAAAAAAAATAAAAVTAAAAAAATAVTAAAATAAAAAATAVTAQSPAVTAVAAAPQSPAVTAAAAAPQPPPLHPSTVRRGFVKHKKITTIDDSTVNRRTKNTNRFKNQRKNRFLINRRRRGHSGGDSNSKERNNIHSNDIHNSTRDKTRKKSRKKIKEKTRKKTRKKQKK